MLVSQNASWSPIFSSTPLYLLSVSTSYSRSFSRSGTLFQATEVGFFHGAGLSGLPGLLLRSRAGWVVTAKAFVILGSIILLV